MTPVAVPGPTLTRTSAGFTVAVAEAMEGTGVEVGELVGVGATVGVSVKVRVGVGVRVGAGVSAAVGVDAAVWVGVEVGAGVNVAVAAGRGVALGPGVEVGSGWEHAAPMVASRAIRPGTSNRLRVVSLRSHRDCRCNSSPTPEKPSPPHLPLTGPDSRCPRCGRGCTGCGPGLVQRT